ncbi:hypothetical protein PROFUN_16152 [Planoprotostelium fungivorum]|uniref:Uncharacterized protein n=1 Tax=Planoprotostelium fungivorum TaxID=1890364 RepID=A0A2P6MSP0_9EUKA|nr:hypothetical protein PROFUN_16152 [Planoprotostelium fungivorum]
MRTTSTTNGNGCACVVADRRSRRGASLRLGHYFFNDTEDDLTLTNGPQLMDEVVTKENNSGSSYLGSGYRLDDIGPYFCLDH